METGRLKSVDLAGGVLILWIMAFHAMNNCKVFGNADVRVVIPFLTFSMPWFFYRSGQFFKELPLRKGVAKDVCKLLRPFAVWSAVGYAVYLVMMAAAGEFSWQRCVWDAAATFGVYGYIPIDVPAWFLLSLFFVRAISRLLLRTAVPPVAAAAVCIVAGFVLHLTGNPLPFYVPNVLMGIAFFMIGYRFGRIEENRTLLAVCLAGYAAFLIWGCSIVGHHRNILLTGYYLLWPLFAYCGIVAFNNLCRMAYATASVRAMRVLQPLAFIGENSMTLLVAHALVYYPVMYFSTLTPWQSVGVIFAGYVLLLTPLLLLKRRKNVSRT
ncbi:acyltransferase family protein [Bacteroides sp. 14(A)]|uniref:acyltransferase family protein n=1 Tax=Bacteroides sp. 14(A) TaxID=1163670 RepID=UPI0004786477|nr:acyltransferase family protein [Bacteroides sp. 14(A)]